MQDLPLDKQILVVVNEILDKRRACALAFAGISLTILAVGLHWPKTYVSTTTLIRDRSEVVRPLLEGTAFTSSGTEQSEIAREVIYSSRNLESVIREAGLDTDASGNLMNDREIEILKAQLRSRIRISRDGNSIIKISYESPEPEEAYLVVLNASRLFIAETTQNKMTGSNEAFMFIENQVNEYKQKLDDINKRINDFKAQNVEIQMDTSEGVNSRISNLNERIRMTSLELKEANIQKDSLVEQLVLESEKSSAQKVVNAQQQRLAELEGQLSALRLSYTDTYPDIVQVKEQIKSLKDNMDVAGNDMANSGAVAGGSRGGGTVRSELYEILSRQIAEQETRIKTLEARKTDQERQFETLIARSSIVNDLVSRLEELSRDRDVTKQIHDQLLKRRENARVSLSLEKENAGTLFKVQEPPVVPLVPRGLRFLHFAIASVVMGAGIPIGIVVGLLLIDPRIRHEDSLSLGDDVPVMGSIATLKTKREARSQKWATAHAVILLLVSVSAVAGLSVSRYLGVL